MGGIEGQSRRGGERVLQRGTGVCSYRGPGAITRRVPAALPAASTCTRLGPLRLAPFPSVLVF